MKHLAVFVLGLLFIGCTGPAAIVQPIAFNHKKHTVDNDIACADCHLHFAKEAYSGRPTLAVCVTCHDAAMTKSKEEAKLIEYATRKEEVPWQRIYRVPKHVRYSHARHVTGGKLECKVCHGLIGESEAPPGKPEVNLTMTFCLACHFSRGISTDCILCHR